MTKEEKLKLAIGRGYKYDKETGIVTTPTGKELNKTNNVGYIYLNPYKDGKTHLILVHQFAWYCVNNEIVECIDHKNQVKTDNWIENLRSVSKLQNQWNQKVRKGYTFNKRDNNWTAQMGFKGKRIFIGNFNTEEEAHEAYLKTKQKFRDEIFNITT